MKKLLALHPHGTLKWRRSNSYLHTQTATIQVSTKKSKQLHIPAVLGLGVHHHTAVLGLSVYHHTAVLASVVTSIYDPLEGEVN